MYEISSNPVYDFVKVLNDTGIQVLEIDGEYFAISEFTPADNNVPYSIVKGKHITSIIKDHLNFGLQGQQLLSVQQRIDQLPDRDIQFSSNYQYKYMIG